MSSKTWRRRPTKSTGFRIFDEIERSWTPSQKETVISMWIKSGNDCYVNLNQFETLDVMSEDTGGDGINWVVRAARPRLADGEPTYLSIEHFSTREEAIACLNDLMGDQGSVG